MQTGDISCPKMGCRPHWRDGLLVEAALHVRQRPGKRAYGLTIEGGVQSRGVRAAGISLPAFTPLEDSLFLTLCARALDNRSSHPILADAAADEMVRKLDYDYDQFHLNTNLIVTCAHRAKKLDEVAARFLDRHPSAIGLDLGTGLDTRSVRIAPPSTADWYDIDFSAVIAARKLLIPSTANAYGVGGDLTTATPNSLSGQPSTRTARSLSPIWSGFRASMIRASPNAGTPN
jgi:Leucine carboxyl methyltransferase